MTISDAARTIGADNSKPVLLVLHGGPGFAMTPWTLTVDGGCGAGGHLMAVCLAPDGQILDRLDR